MTRDDPNDADGIVVAFIVDDLTSALFEVQQARLDLVGDVICTVDRKGCRSIRSAPRCAEHVVPPGQSRPDNTPPNARPF